MLEKRARIDRGHGVPDEDSRHDRKPRRGVGGHAILGSFPRLTRRRACRPSPHFQFTDHRQDATLDVSLSIYTSVKNGLFYDYLVVDLLK